MQRRASLALLTTSPSASRRIVPPSSVLHKAVETQSTRGRCDSTFAKATQVHSIAVPGSNAYAHCDVAVIFGLPFRDAVTSPTYVFFALKGVQGDYCLAI